MNVRKASKKYFKQSLWLIAGLTLLFFLAISIWFQNQLILPVVISAVFALIVSAAEAIIWRKVSEKNAENLPTFYTAASGFRMLFALFVMLIYYIIKGRDAMLPFFLVFAAYYAVLLIFTTIFFSKAAKQQ